VTARGGAALGFAIAFLAGAAPAWSGSIDGSPLALRTVRPADAGAAPADDGRFLAGDAPPLLAQRVITREWGASEESLYVEIDVPGYKSEGWAMLFSAAAPGAGQYYVGESSALWFALAEIAAWTSRWIFRDRARDLHEESIAFTGSPYDTTSHFSFLRWARATAGDTLALQSLYEGDRDAFYRLVGFDERYRGGWGSLGVRDSYRMLENRSQRHYKRGRYATGAIVLTHVVAALDALQAARRNNIPLERNLRLRLKGALGIDGEAMSVALERKF